MPIIPIRVNDALRDAIRYLFAAHKLREATSMNDYLVQLLEADIHPHTRALPERLKIALKCTIRLPRAGRMRRDDATGLITSGSHPPRPITPAAQSRKRPGKTRTAHRQSP